MATWVDTADLAARVSQDIRGAHSLLADAQAVMHELGEAWVGQHSDIATKLEQAITGTRTAIVLLERARGERG